jgi:hypothetical protein
VHICARTLTRARAELSSDPTIRSHLAALYDTLLQQNLLRIIEPYAVVEIAHVAAQVGQGQQEVEAKSVFARALRWKRTVLTQRAQAVADDFGQGVLWRARPGARVPARVRRAGG